MNKVAVQDLDIVPFVLPVYVILDNELALQSILVTLSSMQKNFFTLTDGARFEDFVIWKQLIINNYLGLHYYIVTNQHWCPLILRFYFPTH